jgi:hypothetical protein
MNRIKYFFKNLSNIGYLSIIFSVLIIFMFTFNNASLKDLIINGICTILVMYLEIKRIYKKD